MKVGIYIHIPFCKSRCIYCGFYSTTHSELRQRYVTDIIKEICMRKCEIQALSTPSSPCSVGTVYFGGGTPSSLEITELKSILDAISDNICGKPSEITLEVNPDDVNREYIKAIKSIGINRVSMGVQTFNDAYLHFIHRRHDAKEAEEAFNIIRDEGIENISIDLMFGFPNQTLSEWSTDIEKAIALHPNHISAYSLMFEEGTQLHKMLQRGEINQSDEETSLSMYSELIDQLTANGYEHYEISNFALPGFRSIHNSSYWSDTPYWGFGAAAHSYSGRTRSWNISDLTNYMQSIEKGELPSESESIDADTHYNDLITTALRTKEGLNLEMLEPKYRNYAIECAKNHVNKQLLEIANNSIRLTRKGLFVSDMVMSELIKA